MKVRKKTVLQKPDWDKIWVFMAKNYDIHNIQEFRAAQKNMELLDIGLMAAPIHNEITKEAV